MRVKYPRCGPVLVRLDHRAYRPGGRVGGHPTFNPCARHVTDHRSINHGARHIFLRSYG